MGCEDDVGETVITRFFSFWDFFWILKMWTQKDQFRNRLIIMGREWPPVAHTWWRPPYCAAMILPLVQHEHLGTVCPLLDFLMNIWAALWLVSALCIGQQYELRAIVIFCDVGDWCGTVVVYRLQNPPHTRSLYEKKNHITMVFNGPDTNYISWCVNYFYAGLPPLNAQNGV